MGYSSSYWYADYKGWDASISDNKPAGVSGSYLNYEGKFLNPSQRSTTYSNTWQYILDNPDRFALHFMEQKLLQWLQAIGTDAARTYYSLADWNGATNTHSSMGTVFELLGQDYLAGKKTIDNINGYRNIFMSRWSRYYMRYMMVRGAQMSKFSSPLGAGSESDGVCQPNSDGQQTAPNCTDVCFLVEGYTPTMSYWNNVAIAYDYAVVMDDTPGNEYFYILWRNSPYRVNNAYGPPSIFEEPDGTYACRRDTTSKGLQPSNRRWGILTGYGRIQDLDNTLPELTGTDPGWYYVSQGHYMGDIGPYTTSSSGISFSPNLELAATPELIYRHRVADVHLRADSTGVRPDTSIYYPENTDRPANTLPFAHPGWVKELAPLHSRKPCDHPTPLAMRNNDVDGHGGIGMYPDASPKYDSRTCSRQWGIKAPIYTHHANVMGHTGTNMMITTAEYSVQYVNIHGYQNSPPTFAYDGSVWENFDGMAFRTGIAAP